MRWLADENLNNDFLRALLRRQPNLDIVRVQDVELSGADDARVLAWAAQQGRVLLTHDVSTITAEAYRRTVDGEPMPGVFEVPRSITIAAAVEDILLLSECSEAGEWEGQVRYLPLR